MKAQIKELENIVEEQKLVIAEKTKKEFNDKETRHCKATKAEVRKLKSENEQLESKVKLAQSDFKMEKDQVVKKLKASVEALEAMKNDLKI